VTCLVERTVWKWVDFRNDIYIPLCYDAVGHKGALKIIIDTAAFVLRNESCCPESRNRNRYKNKTY